MYKILGLISSFEEHSLYVEKQSRTPFKILLCHSSNFSPHDLSFEDTVMMFSDHP